MAADPKTPTSRHDIEGAEHTINEKLGVPKGVALSMGAGLLGLFIGGAAVAFTAAVVAPAVRSRWKKYNEKKSPAADQ